MKNAIILVAFSLLYFCSFQLVAQIDFEMMSLAEMQERNPEHAAEFQRIQVHTEEFIRNLHEGRVTTQLVTIPTVFHVIEDPNNVNNLPDSQILEQLSQLNDDFRRQNSNADNTWPQADDMEIEFCLATRAPDGYATTGIIRYNYGAGPWVTDEVQTIIQPETIWNSNHYLNIWILPALETSSGQSRSGIITLPGGNPNTDGVVIVAWPIGSLSSPNTLTATAPTGGCLPENSQMGRVLTGYVGHWLNLFYLWGDFPSCNNDDLVEDTPNEDESIRCCADIGESSCGSVDMVQNFMTIAGDACQNLFTTGQKERMQALFVRFGAREGILSSLGCTEGIPCEDNLNITDTYNNGDNEYIEVQDWINSTATVNTGARVTHDAGNYVCLNTGFIADNGSVFLAKIDGCDNNPSERLAENKSLQNNTKKVETAYIIEQVAMKNYPNPFTGQTVIEFTLSQDESVTLSVSDMTGRQVAVLINDEQQIAGTRQVIFNGSSHPAGMYYYTIQAGQYIGTQKMTLMK